MGNRELEKGNFEAAIKFYSEGLKINPRNAGLYYNRGIVWGYMNEGDKAIADYTKALEINKEFISAYLNRGIERGKKSNYDLAISDYTTAMQLDPDKATRANLYFLRACEWFEIKDYDRAIDDYSEGIRINPTDTEAYYCRAEAWYSKGNFDNAISDYTKAIQIDPKYTKAVFNRANTWHEKREYASAIIDYEKAIELDQKNTHVYNNYSWLLSTCPDNKFRDGAKALNLALKAFTLNPDEVASLDTLAAAYAELGNFKQAVQAMEKAIMLLQKHNNENLLNNLVPHLESYKAGKPWREDVKSKDWMRN